MMPGARYATRHSKSVAAVSGTYSGAALAWPLDCYKGEPRLNHIDYPDVNKTGHDFKCDPADIRGHEGADLNVDQSAAERGVNVLAAAGGTVQWVF